METTFVAAMHNIEDKLHDKVFSPRKGWYLPLQMITPGSSVFEVHKGNRDDKTAGLPGSKGTYVPAVLLDGLKGFLYYKAWTNGSEIADFAQKAYNTVSSILP